MTILPSENCSVFYNIILLLNFKQKEAQLTHLHVFDYVTFSKKGSTI